MARNALLMVFFIMAGFVTGCASNPPVIELRAGVHNAAFIQFGTEPLQYSLGIVDGKSFWVFGLQQNVTIPVPGITAAQAANATAALHAGAALGAHEIDKEAELVPDMFRAMLNKRPIVSEIAQGVLPAVADTWGVPYQRDQVRVLSTKSTFQTEDGIFTWDDPKTDIVMVFYVYSLKLTEKPSTGGFLAAVGTLGFNDKDVAPEFVNHVLVFKRDPADRKLKRVWQGHCSSFVLSMPVSRKFSELRASPGNSKAMFDGAVNTTIDMCRQQLARQAG